MAPPSKAQTTMTEGLTTVLSDIAKLQAAPDADLDFLTSLQQAIVGKIRSMQPGGQQPGQPGQPSPGGMGGPAGMVQGGAMQGLSPTGGGQLPDMGGAGGPNMDELRRALGSSSKVS